MKKNFSKGIFHLALIILMLAIAPNQSVQSQNLQNKNYSSWFTSKQIADKVWVISDHGADNFYLVEGQDSALLIDNGLGLINVRDYVASLTKLPVIVVNTHGHPDHAGANYQFPVVYGHPADFRLMDAFKASKQRQSSRKKMVRDAGVPDEIIFKDTLDLKPTVMVPVKEGYIFDLGKRKLEVIETPGHTAGSICLLDKQNKLLFTGDDNNALNWLFLDESLPLEVYFQSLKKLDKRKGEFNTLYPGHGEPMENSFIEEEIICVRRILNGSCQTKPYFSYRGGAQMCSYKRASVAFNPDNLYLKK